MLMMLVGTCGMMKASLDILPMRLNQKERHTPILRRTMKKAFGPLEERGLVVENINASLKSQNAVMDVGDAVSLPVVVICFAWDFRDIYVLT